MPTGIFRSEPFDDPLPYWYWGEVVSQARPFTQSLRWERVWSHPIASCCQHNCIRCGQLVLIVREVQFNSFLRAALMIALLNNCVVAKTSRTIFFHPHCLYTDVTATLNQLPVQEIPGPVETKPLWEFDQTSDWVKGLAGETRGEGGGRIKMMSASTSSANEPAKDLILVHTVQLKVIIKV